MVGWNVQGTCRGDMREGIAEGTTIVQEDGRRWGRRRGDVSHYGFAKPF